MRKAFSLLCVMSLLFYSSIVYCTSYDFETLKSIATEYEANLVSYSSLGSWQFNDVPVSVPEGYSKDDFHVEPDEPKGEVIGAEIDYFIATDNSKLYQVYNTGNEIYVVDYNQDGTIEQIMSWRY